MCHVCIEILKWFLEFSSTYLFCLFIAYSFVSLACFWVSVKALDLPLLAIISSHPHSHRQNENILQIISLDKDIEKERAREREWVNPNALSVIILAIWEMMLLFVRLLSAMHANIFRAKWKHANQNIQVSLQPLGVLIKMPNDRLSLPATGLDLSIFFILKDFDCVEYNQSSCWPFQSAAQCRTIETLCQQTDCNDRYGTPFARQKKKIRTVSNCNTFYF